MPSMDDEISNLGTAHATLAIHDIDKDNTSVTRSEAKSVYQLSLIKEETAAESSPASNSGGDGKATLP